MRRTILAVLSIATVAPTQTPAAAVSALDEKTRADCVALVETAMQRNRIPGLSLAVGRAGALVWTRGFGLADVENEVPATDKTVYRLASISKPITAVAVMKLVELGAFDLDKDIGAYLEEFPQKRWMLTPRHLLSHVGGVRHYRPGEIFSTTHYGTVRAALKIFAHDPLLYQPGTKYSYTTYGYNLLGAAMVAATEERFAKLIQKHVFEPAGMKHTQVDSIRRIIPHRAQGYALDVFKQLRNSRIVDTSNKVPGGGLCGTAADLVRFGHALLSGRVVKRDTLDAMWTPVKTKDGKELSYGLGFRILRAKKPRIVGHSGGQPRVNTMLIIRPDEEIVVAVMCNLERGGAGRIARAVSDVVSE